MADSACFHPAPVPFGASEVVWRQNGTGSVALPCSQCGEYRIWTIEGEK
jgi:hypothetical protein